MLFLSVLILCLTNGIHLLFALVFGLFCFFGALMLKGFSFKSVFKMMADGMRNVVPVLRVFVLIGAITAVWRASGTIPFFVYHGVSLIAPNFFVLFAFLLTCFVGMLIGSSFGVVGTIGVVLMVLARSGGADPTITAGAVIAGAYFGDRNAPTSSSANLVATLTKTNVIDNVKNMLKSAFIPMLASIAIYAALSVYHPMSGGDNSLVLEIPTLYNISFAAAIPAVLVIILPVLKFNVLVSISASVLSGVFVALFVQNMRLLELFKFILMGYKLEGTSQFAGIISGGGVVSMVSTMFVVLIASGYAGIFKGSGVLNGAVTFLEKCSRKFPLFPLTFLTATLAAAFGCNQTLSVILTNQIMGGIYAQHGKSQSALALDIEDSSIVVAAMLPWNIAVSVPMVMLAVGVESIPYAVFLYLLPLYRMLKK